MWYTVRPVIRELAPGIGLFANKAWKITSFIILQFFVYNNNSKYLKFTWPSNIKYLHYTKNTYILVRFMSREVWQDVDGSPEKSTTYISTFESTTLLRCRQRLLEVFASTQYLLYSISQWQLLNLGRQRWGHWQWALGLALGTGAWGPHHRSATRGRGGREKEKYSGASN